MARPIEPTPTLTGSDATRLLRSLEKACSPAEARRRQKIARDTFAELTRPKFKKATSVRAARKSR